MAQVIEARFRIFSKGRKYYSALMDDKYKCRIEISPDLDCEVGDVIHILAEDLSIKNKFGTSLIYRKHGSIPANSSYTTLSHSPFNSTLVKRCQALSGKWDKENKCWFFREEYWEEVEKLDFLYNSNPVIATIKLKCHVAVGDFVEVGGYNLARYMWSREGGYFLKVESISMNITDTEEDIKIPRGYHLLCEGTTFKFRLGLHLLKELNNDCDFFDKWELCSIENTKISPVDEEDESPSDSPQLS